MPKGSKKRKAMKRKQETTNHHPSSTNSTGTQGNVVGGEHDSSDRLLIDEDFSPRSSMETPPDPEPYPEPRHVVAASKEALVIGEPGPETAVCKEPPVVIEPEPAVTKKATVVPQPIVSNDALLIPQYFSGPEQNEALSTVALEVLDELSTSAQVEDKAGEVSFYHEQIDVLEHKPAVSEDTLYVHVEQPNVSESEQAEAATTVASEVLNEPSSPFKDGKKSGDLSLYHEQTKLPHAISRDASISRSPHLLKRRTSWWNCCGLLDVFGGARR